MNREELMKIIQKEAFKMVRPGDFEIHTKSRGDFVTEVDRSIELSLRRILQEAFTEVAFLGEETGVSGQGVRRWVLDPVDGTTNFIMDLRFSVLSLALMEGEKRLMGLIYNPYTQELFYAERGAGCFINGEKVTTPTRSPLGVPLVSVGMAPRDRHLGPMMLDILRDMYEKGYDIRRFGSAALEMAYVAAGRLSAYYERGLHPWDYGAAALMVEEAGGVFYKDGPWVLASAPSYVEEFLPIFQKHGVFCNESK